MFPHNHSPESGLGLQEQVLQHPGCVGAAVEPVPMVPCSGKQCYLLMVLITNISVLYSRRQSIQAYLLIIFPK